MLLASTAFLALEVVHRIAFVLDDLFYPGWRDEPVEAPVFVVGAPRSGTTWFHRLLARDRATFTAMSLGEILVAPAVCQKKLLLGLAALDRWLGAPLARAYRALHKRSPSPFGDVHEYDLMAAEEDELLMLHLWASHIQCLLCAHDPYQETLAYFDRNASRDRRSKVMGFYRDMLKRHLYVVGGRRHFLSKNPCFAARLLSLNETFPDARMVVMLRTADQVIPSVLNLTAVVASALCNRDLEGPAHVERTLRLVEHFYQHPADVGPTLFAGRLRNIAYTALLGDLEQEALAVYALLGVEPGADVRRALVEEAGRARRHEPRFSGEQPIESERRNGERRQQAERRSE
jgi:hypothetical protein